MRPFAATTLLALAACAGPAGTASAPAPEGPPSTFRYQPAVAHYRGVQHRHVEQEFQGQVTSNDQVTRYRLTVAVTGEAEPYETRFTLDSLDLTGAQGLSPDQVADVRGAAFSGMMLSSGRLETFTVGDSSQSLGMQVAATLRDFFPVIPEAGVEPGTTWADTASRSVVSNGIELAVETISQHESVAWTELAGVRVLEVLTTSEYTVSGTGQQGGQDLELEGVGRTYATRFLADDGTYSGSISADTAEIDVFLTGLGLIVPVRQYSADTLQAVR